MEDQVKTISNDEEKAYRLIDSAFELNQISKSGALSACINMALHIIAQKGASQESIDGIIQAVVRAASALDAAVVVSEGNHGV
jgi:hypothetical protein